MKNFGSFSVRSILLFGLLLLALLLTGALSIGWYELQQVHRAHDVVVHAYEVIHGVERIISLVNDEESDQKALVISNDKRLLKADRDKIFAQIDRVRTLTKNNPFQSSALAELQNEIASKLSSMHKKLAGRAEFESSSQKSLAIMLENKALMDSIDARLMAIQNDEFRTFGKSLESRRVAVQHFVLAFAFITSAVLILFVAMTIAINRFLDERENAALTDDLTGLYNRRGFNVLAPQLVKSARRSKLGCAIYFVDMDGLKPINDHFGHEQGSKALGLLADALKTIFRDEDLIARWGGDEFVIAGLVRSLPDQQAVNERFANELIRRKRASSLPYDLKASLGLTAIDPKEMSVETLALAIKTSDEKMYAVKKGRKADQENGRG